MLPETANSHLASELERRKARKILQRIAQRKRAAALNTFSQQQQKPARKQAFGKPLDSQERDAIIGAIGKIGRDRVVVDLMKIDPNRNRGSAMGIIREVTQSASHRFASTTRSLLGRLARQYRGGEQTTLPAVSKVAQPSGSLVHDNTRQALSNQDMIQTISSAVAVAVSSVLGPMLQASQQQSPPLLPSPDRVSLVTQRGAIKQFAELDEAGQMNILHAMHSRYGDSLRDQGVVRGGEHRAAWKVSYDAYDRETGNNVQARASAEGDSTGHRVTPCEMIRRDGHLVKFYEVVRKTWER